MFNLDSSWLSAPVASYTYKNVADQYVQVLRTSLEPVLSDFEDVWSFAWLPRGQAIRFDRSQLVRGDLTTSSAALAALVTAGILTPEAAAAYLALPTVGGGLVGVPQSTSPTPATPASSPAPPPPPDDEEEGNTP